MKPNPSLGVLLNTFEGTDSQYAGGHVHSLEVLERLEGYDITVFAPEYARSIISGKLPAAAFVAMPTLPADAPKSMYLFLHRAIMSLRRIDALRTCDVIYATSPSLPDILPAAIARPGRVTVCIFHVVPPPWKRSGPIIRNLIAFVADAFGLSIASMCCRSVIVGTTHAARQLRMRGFRQPLFVTTNGVDRVMSIVGERSAASAIFVGRLHPTKGLVDLLAIWAIVLSNVPEATLTIVGDGSASFKDQLFAIVERRQLAASVRFAGRVDDATRTKLLSSSSIFVFPSYEEGWGIAVAEAMAAGLPCVTYRLPVYEEVFPRGLAAAAPGDVASFAEIVVGLFRDGELRRTMSNEATALSRTFSWERAASIEQDALATHVRHRTSKECDPQ